MGKKRKNEVSWKDLNIDVITKLLALFDVFVDLSVKQQEKIIKILGSLTS